MSPYGALDTIDQIENALFQSGCRVADTRSTFSSLHNRFPFLFTVGGILRGESVYMAELSDLLHTQIQREDHDPHPVTIMILQMATGKTNQELKLYSSRVGRNVNLCPICALGFYLVLYRFHYTGEWDIPPDFTDN
jgi:hypothetical protein